MAWEVMGCWGGRWLSTAFADATAADSTASCSATFALFIDASSMIGSYTDRFAGPGVLPASWVPPRLALSRDVDVSEVA
ncbi:hypothetical protein ACFY94_07385 [Streptomyces griseorubiginosus]|uniref:hypothetical protein n=1 Tax=Streptomyces griseorubiginosus TaxID=67304 RepID=UPI0036E63219